MADSGRDRAGLRMVAFVAGLVLVLLAGFGLGRVAGPTGAATRGGGMANGTGAAAHGHGDDGHGHAGGEGPTARPTGAATVGGLAVAEAGYRLVPQPGAPFRFRVDGPDRRPATSFAVAHDKQMHLVVVRRDLTGYRHLHPTMAPDGTWSVDLPLTDPGIWRAYADFAVIRPDGSQLALTLGTDLTVAGPYQPRDLPGPTRQSTVDGLVVTYEGTPGVGVTAPLLFRVSADGQPVKDLERYLGSYGHLVVLREGDLGYVHVHPEEQLLGGAVKFWLAAPSPGRYRMFFDFQIAGTVRTAEFTLEVP